MRVNHLFYLIGLILSISPNVAGAADSISVKKTIQLVKIGPQELDPDDLMDPIVLRNLRIDEALKARNNEIAVLRDLQKNVGLKRLLASNETSHEVDLELALEQYRLARNLKGQALVYVTFGVYYGQKGEYEKAIANFSEALRLSELLKDKLSVSRAYENLAALYKAAGNLNQAAVFHEELIKLNSSLNRHAQVGLAYLELAEIKVLQNKFDQAENYIIKKALPLFRRTAYGSGRMKGFQQLADIYFRQNRLSEAKWFYIQANIMADKLNNREAKVENLVNLAGVKFLNGETALAIADYREAEVLAKEQNYLAQLVQIKGNLGEIYHQVGDYADAGTELDEYSRLRTALMKTGL